MINKLLTIFESFYATYVPDILANAKEFSHHQFDSAIMH